VIWFLSLIPTVMTREELVQRAIRLVLT